MAEAENFKTSTRRGVLRGIGGVAGLGTIGVVSGEEDDTVTIVTEAGGANGEKAVKEVPKAWYEYENRVDEALHRARELYSANSGVRSIHLVPSSTTKGGKRVSQLEIGFSPSAIGRASQYPTGVDGIPMATSTMGEISPSAGCHYSGSANEVNGGVSIETDLNSNNRFSYGTNTCKVNVNGNTGILTCAHMWGNCSVASENRSEFTSVRSDRHATSYLSVS